MQMFPAWITAFTEWFKEYKDDVNHKLWPVKTPFTPVEGFGPICACKFISRHTVQHVTDKISNAICVRLLAVSMRYIRVLFFRLHCLVLCVCVHEFRFFFTSFKNGLCELLCQPVYSVSSHVIFRLVDW